MPTPGRAAGTRPSGKKDNAVDGVEADVLYTTLGFRIFWLKDAGLQADCFRVYNDWLAEFVSYDPKHMAGLPMISLYDPKAGARELERCAKMGLKGAMIWCSPPQEQPYSSDVYDPFWAAAQELNMPVSLHAITGMGMESQYNWGERYMRSTVLSHEVEKSFSVLIFSGVLDRFPQLQIVSAENNIGWIPYYLQRMDRAFERQRISAGFTEQAEAERIFPAADVGDLYRRFCRRREPPVHRGRPDDVVVRLSAPGLDLAAFAGRRRPRLQGRQRRGQLQDHPRQRRPALRVRRLVGGSADQDLDADHDQPGATQCLGDATIALAERCPSRMPSVVIANVAKPIAAAVAMMPTPSKARLTPTASASMLVPIAVITEKPGRMALRFLDLGDAAQAVIDHLDADRREHGKRNPMIGGKIIAGAHGRAEQPADDRRYRLDDAENQAAAQRFPKRGRSSAAPLPSAAAKASEDMLKAMTTIARGLIRGRPPGESSTQSRSRPDRPRVRTGLAKHSPPALRRPRHAPSREPVDAAPPGFGRSYSPMPLVPAPV